MKLTLTIDQTGNAAFCDPDGNPDDDHARAEIARIMERAVGDVREGFGGHGYLRDVNGNTVGEWSLTD